MLAGIADCSEGFTPPLKMSKRCVNQSDGNFGKKEEIWLKILAALSAWLKATTLSGQHKTQAATLAVARTEPALRLREPNHLVLPLSSAQTRPGRMSSFRQIGWGAVCVAPLHQTQ